MQRERGQHSGSKQVICLRAEMELDIHTGMDMNMEPGSDFENGTVENEALQ